MCCLAIIKKIVELTHLNLLKNINVAGVQWSDSNFIFSSPELKAQVSFSDCPLSVVCLSV
jgi:hypothetical protein